MTDFYLPFNSKELPESTIAGTTMDKMIQSNIYWVSNWPCALLIKHFYFYYLKNNTKKYLSTN